MSTKIDAAEIAAARRQAEIQREQARRAAEARKATAAAAKKTAPKKIAKDEMSTGSGVALRRRAAEQLPAAQPARARKTGKFKPQDIAIAQKRYQLGQDDEVSRTHSGATSRTDETPPTPEEQAALDSRQVQKAWDEAKSGGRNDAFAAQAAAQKLETLTRQHSTDRVYSNALIRASSSTIERINGAIAKNANGQDFYQDGKDEGAIKSAVKAMSETAHNSGQIGTFLIADSLAKKVDNRSELENLDDAFYELADEHKSGDLFNALGARLDAQGKGSAASELRDRHEGFFDDPLGSVGDAFGDVVGAVGNAGGAVLGFAEDVGESALHVATGAAHLAVDAAKGTVDVLDDAVELTTDAVKDAVKYAAEQGLKLGGKLLGAAHGLALDGIDGALDVGEHIDSLKAGDTYKLGGGVSVNAGVDVSVDGDIGVTKNTDGTYTVSGQLNADVGVKLFEGAFAGIGGKAEFKFDNAEDAKKAALTLASAGAALAAGPVLAPALVPHPDELKFLASHVKSLQVSAEAGVSVDGSFEVSPAIDVGGMASAEVKASYRLEFVNGKPAALVRDTTIEGSGVGGASLAMLRDQATRDPKLAGFLNGAQVSAEGDLTVETSIPLDASKIGDIGAFIASPVSAAFAGSATTSVMLHGQVQAGTRGAQGSLWIGDIQGSEVSSVVSHLLRGDLDHATEGVDVAVGGSASTFDESEGGSFRVGIDVVGVGFDIEGHNRVRHTTHATSFGEPPPAATAFTPEPNPGGSPFDN